MAYTSAYTGAEIDAICREATMRTIRRFINSGTDQKTTKPQRLEVTMEDLQEAVKKVNEHKRIVENNAG